MATGGVINMKQTCCRCSNRSTAKTFDCLIWNRAFRRFRWKNFASFVNTSNHGWVAGITRSSSFKTGSKLLTSWGVNAKTCSLLKHVINRRTRIVYLRESFQRVGTSVAAYLQYNKICSTNLAPYSIRSDVNDPSRNIQDLDEYSMQKFLDDMVGPIMEPAYKRYW